MDNIEHNFYVVGIGASAGGLTAIQALFDGIPDNTGMAFVIVQHLSPNYKSLMPELLSKHTQMEIYTSENEQELLPNRIYLNQRNKNIEVKGDKLYLLERAAKHELNLPIDIFFHSIGKEFKEKSIGIILSGTGSDGSRGIKTIKETGGTILVEDPFSAQFDGMPNSAISTNLVDYVLPPNKMAKTLMEIAQTKMLKLSKEQKTENFDDIAFSNILDDIHLSYGIDFKHYKRNTLLRRIEKRMTINNILSIQEYQAFLSSRQEEKEMLKKDFFIGVTSFFRDPEAFYSLRLKIIPELFKDRDTAEPVRIWVPGCSTGEEAFSLAILIDQYIRKYKPNSDFKIFATDVDVNALNRASLASYHINAASELNSEILEKYFIKTSDKIQIIKRIRKKIFFSSHNVISDPPFIHMDLISCRNMLIYINSMTQQNVLKNFLFSLNKLGYLFLGNSEDLGEMGKYFKTINSKWKIYQNISETKILPAHIYDIEAKEVAPPSTTLFPSMPRYIGAYEESPENTFERYLSSFFSPDCIFFDKKFNILYLKGNAGKRLILKEGLFENNLLKMSNFRVSILLKEGVDRLQKSDKDILMKNVLISQDDKNSAFDLTFHRTPKTSEVGEIYMLSFSEEKEVKEDIIELQSIPVDEISKQRIENLEIELQNAIEQLETSNEELQSSNEELMASNEELQSTNEELQSVNEELYTVNAELQEKNKELQNLNDDINNLLNSTDIGTLFLDPNLCIRKYTLGLQKHFNLQEGDLGRSIINFAPNFSEKVRQSMIHDSQKALKQYTPIEEEIQDNEGNFFLRKITPFVTNSKEIGGVVISFVEITKLKNTEKKLTAQTSSLEKSVEELERFNKAAIGRELKMIELKKQINELKKNLGEDGFFDLSFINKEEKNN